MTQEEIYNYIVANGEEIYNYFVDNGHGSRQVSISKLDPSIERALLPGCKILMKYSYITNEYSRQASNIAKLTQAADYLLTPVNHVSNVRFDIPLDDIDPGKIIMIFPSIFSGNIHATIEEILNQEKEIERLVRERKEDINEIIQYHMEEMGKLIEESEILEEIIKKECRLN